MEFTVDGSVHQTICTNMKWTRKTVLHPFTTHTHFGALSGNSMMKYRQIMQ